jgi:uracil-DNA glycosylase
MNTTQQINISEIQKKLVETINHTDWYGLLNHFITKSEFQEILEKLVFEVEEGKRFVPKIKNTLNAFKECSFKDLKIVVIGQDPYPWLYKNHPDGTVADGLAFSCGHSMKIQPSLEYIYNAMGKEPDDRNPDLKYLANQGVLLLNSAFTVEVNKPGTHYHIWKPFMNIILDAICYNKSGIVFILLGKVAQQFEDMITEDNLILKASHPASAGYNKGIWNCEDVFNKTNEYLKQRGKTIIQW